LTEKELFETYRKDVYRTCYYLLHHAEDAEDACQEIFLTAFRHDWRSVNYLKTWLMRVAVNHCINHLRKRTRARRQLFELRAEASAVEAPAEAAVERRETAEECRRLLQRLPEKLRAAVTLRYIHEFSLQETAAVLEIPVGTVKSRVDKGKKLLLEMMFGTMTEEGAERDDRNERRGRIFSFTKQ